MPRARAISEGAQSFVGTRWVDTVKASGEHRSRLVAKELATTVRDDLFAPTPSLEAFKYVVSSLASHGELGAGDNRLLLIDVRRAFFYAPVTRTVYITLPPEEVTPGRYEVARLQKALYGTRDAPQCWAKAVARFMQGLGFTRGHYNPCLYWHPKKHIKAVVHVDDFALEGPKSSLQWFEKEIAESFDVKTAYLGPGPGEEKELPYLGRTVRWRCDGISYEANPKYAQEYLESLDLGECKSVSTPGAPDADADRAHEKVPAKEAFLYRRLAAQMNYLQQDRADLSFAAMRMAQSMANPAESDGGKVKRVARHLNGAMRCEVLYRWQQPPTTIVAYSDSDWAGCTRTRRSTSGGVLFHGSHAIKHWAKMQGGVAVSSGEAELYACNKAIAEAIGLGQLCADLGDSRAVEGMVDASACKAMLQRTGAGRSKHIQVAEYWLQELIERGQVKVHKIPRTDNCSDALTHHWTAAEGHRHFASMGMELCAL